MMTCQHLGRIHSPADKWHPDVYDCAGGFSVCTLEPSKLTRQGGLMASCVRSDGLPCEKFVELQMPVAKPFVQTRLKSNFAYFTGTNRVNEKQMIETMIRSARAAGVPEDFHVFSPMDIEGAANYRIEASRSWKNHFTKVDFLKELHDIAPQYDYYVWLDTDNLFVRDPGDLKELIRDNKAWVSMESELTSSENKHPDWQGVPRDKLLALMRELGCDETVYNTNGGMWIVRGDAVDEFHRKAFELRGVVDTRAGRNVDDEVVLAILGQTFAKDPANNAFEKHKHIWACDWHSAWGESKGKLPDGSEWQHHDWLTGAALGPINPAIVHCMRSKRLLAGDAWKWHGHAPQSGHEKTVTPIPSKEPVGDKLKEIFEECGVERPANCNCNAWIASMNGWGIRDCQKHRTEIVAHLNEAAKQIRTEKGVVAGWLAMGRVAAKGYLTTDSLLNEAIRRTEASLPKMGVAWKSDDLSTERPIRAVMVTPSLGMGGAERWVQLLSTRSDSSKVRWRVVVLSLGVCYEPFAQSISRCPNAELHVVGRLSSDAPCKSYESADEAVSAAAQGADVIVSWGGGEWTNPRKDLPAVFASHGCCEWTRDALLKAIENGTNHYVAVSRFAAEALNSPIPPTTIWNAVDPKRLVVTRDRESVQRDVWKTHTEWTSQDRVHVGYLGRMAAEKNPIAAAQAVANLPWYYKCVLIGSGTEERTLLQQARTMIPSRLTHLPTVEDVGNHLNALDVFVMASPREGNSLALAEAMLCGVPIVTTRVGAVEEYEQMTGCPLFWSVPTHPTANELAVAVREASVAGRSDPRVKAAQEFAQAHLTADKMVEEWAQYLKAIVSIGK